MSKYPDGPRIDVSKPTVVNDLVAATADSMQHLPVEKEQEMRQKAAVRRDELESQGIGGRYIHDVAENECAKG